MNDKRSSSQPSLQLPVQTCRRRRKDREGWTCMRAGASCKSASSCCDGAEWKVWAAGVCEHAGRTKSSDDVAKTERKAHLQLLGYGRVPDKPKYGPNASSGCSYSICTFTKLISIWLSDSNWHQIKIENPTTVNGPLTITPAVQIQTHKTSQSPGIIHSSNICQQRFLLL